MSVGPRIIEAIGSDGTGLRVVFVRVGDRFAHRIEAVPPTAATMVFESVEGDNQDDWPPSPPLQQLTVEKRSGDKTVALLVGAAGKTHWSASVESDPQQRHITFDVACRLGETARRLSSSYRVVADAKAARPARKPLRLEIHPSGQALPTRIDAAEQGWLIRPQGDQAPASATVRWTYRVSLSEVDPSPDGPR